METVTTFMASYWRSFHISSNFEIWHLGNAISCVLRELFIQVHTSKSKYILLDFREGGGK
jgi:hypothetical protein